MKTGITFDHKQPSINKALGIADNEAKQMAHCITTALLSDGSNKFSSAIELALENITFNMTAKHYILFGYYFQEAASKAEQLNEALKQIKGDPDKLKEFFKGFMSQKKEEKRSDMIMNRLKELLN